MILIGYWYKICVRLHTYIQGWKCDEVMSVIILLASGRAHKNFIPITVKKILRTNGYPIFIQKVTIKTACIMDRNANNLCYKFQTVTYYNFWGKRDITGQCIRHTIYLWFFRLRNLTTWSTKVLSCQIRCIFLSTFPQTRWRMNTRIAWSNCCQPTWLCWWCDPARLDGSSMAHWRLGVGNSFVRYCPFIGQNGRNSETKIHCVSWYAHHLFLK